MRAMVSPYEHPLPPNPAQPTKHTNCVGPTPPPFCARPCVTAARDHQVLLPQLGGVHSICQQHLGLHALDAVVLGVGLAHAVALPQGEAAALLGRCTVQLQIGCQTCVQRPAEDARVPCGVPWAGRRRAGGQAAAQRWWSRQGPGRGWWPHPACMHGYQHACARLPPSTWIHVHPKRPRPTPA